jgi:general secretion pathway protein D
MKQFVWIKITIILFATFALLMDAPAQRQGGNRQGRNSQSKSYGSNLAGDAIIEVDPETGSLVIIADEETNAQIKKIIASLDKPIPQVLIKVLFLEVTHNDGLDLGVEGIFGFDSTTEGDRDFLDSAFGVGSMTQGGFYRLMEKDLSVTMRAMAEVGKLEVLSRPSILARNNEEAIITVGKEIARPTNSRILQDGQTLTSFEYIDIGIILQVTPRITEDGLVEMELYPEISTLTGETIQISESIDARVVAKRSAETVVVVPNGQTVVIGGLMEDNYTETVKKVPVLGDIPILGGLFRRKTKTKIKTELLIFLTPIVVSTGRELKELSISEKKNTELVPKVFTEKQMDKFIDNLEN